MKKHARWLLPFVLIAYSFLYIATQKECDEECEAWYRFIGLMRTNRPFISAIYNPRPTMVCITVQDTTVQNWDALADTACAHLKSVNLPNRTVAFFKIGGRDTLVKRTCP